MINLQSSTPLYQQLKKLLSVQIEDGQLPAGLPILSERELCGAYNLSRTTIRQAINDLVNEGVLERRPGKGTFVATRKISQGLVKITSFEKTIINQGLVPATKVVEAKEIDPDVEIAHALGASVNEKVVKLALLGLANNDPLVYYTSFFSCSLGKYMIEKAMEKERQGQSFSTYDMYKNDCGVDPVCSQQFFEASTPDQATQRILQIKRGAPVFLVTSFIKDAAGKTLEYRKAFYRGDRYKFQVVREM